MSKNEATKAQNKLVQRIAHKLSDGFECFHDSIPFWPAVRDPLTAVLGTHMISKFLAIFRGNKSSGIIATTKSSTIRAEERGEQWALDGLNFEKYIITRFGRDGNRLLDWRGDKFIQGYGGPESSGDPDVLFMTRHGKNRFAIECKYRSNWWHNHPKHGTCIEWAREDQFLRYMGFERRRGITVYVAIGVGGTSSNPAELFIGRIEEIKFRIARKYHLERFRMELPIPDGGLEFA